MHHLVQIAYKAAKANMAGGGATVGVLPYDLAVLRACVEGVDVYPEAPKATARARHVHVKREDMAELLAAVEKASRSEVTMPPPASSVEVPDD